MRSPRQHVVGRVLSTKNFKNILNYFPVYFGSNPSDEKITKI